MRFATDLLYRFIRSQASGNAQPDEVEVELPPVILPVAMIPGPLATLRTQVGATIQRDSLAFEMDNVLGASSVAIDSLVVTLGRGMWRLMISHHHHADFTSVPSTATRGTTLLLQDPASENIIIHRFPNIANVLMAKTLDFIVVFPTDTWELHLISGPTGVGQTMQSNADGLALRLN